jgi:hypothetical protein
MAVSPVRLKFRGVLVFEKDFLGQSQLPALAARLMQNNVLEGILGGFECVSIQQRHSGYGCVRLLGVRVGWGTERNGKANGR